MLAEPPWHSSSKDPNRDGKIAFYSRFAEGAGQGGAGSGAGAGSVPGPGCGTAPSCGGRCRLHSLARTSRASRCVHAANELITVQLLVRGRCCGVSNWMNEIFHRKRFLINYS